MASEHTKPTYCIQNLHYRKESSTICIHCSKKKAQLRGGESKKQPKVMFGTKISCSKDDDNCGIACIEPNSEDDAPVGTQELEGDDVDEAACKMKCCMHRKRIGCKQRMISYKRYSILQEQGTGC